MMHGKACSDAMLGNMGGEDSLESRDDPSVELLTSCLGHRNLRRPSPQLHLFPKCTLPATREVKYSIKTCKVVQDNNRQACSRPAEGKPFFLFVSWFHVVFLNFPLFDNHFARCSSEYTRGNRNVLGAGHPFSWCTSNPGFQEM